LAFWERIVHRKLFVIHIVLLLTAVLNLALPVTAFAQDTPPGTPTDDDVNAIARQLFCPVCENVPLDVCGTQACAQWRELIREKLAEGWSEDEIKQYFVDHYGARVLSEPPPEGFNWLAYLIPPLAFLAGAFFLYRGFMVWRQVDEDDVSMTSDFPEDEAPSDVVSNPQDDYMTRLEEELKNRA